MYLSIYLSIHLSIYLSTYLSIFLSAYLSIYPFIYQSIYLSLSLCLSIYPPVYLLSASSKTKHFWETSSFSTLTTAKTKQFYEASAVFELDNLQNEAILRDFFNFWTWQHQKQSNSARLPWRMESQVQRWQPHTNAFWNFSTPPI